MEEDKDENLTENEKEAEQREYFRLDKAILVSYCLKDDPKKIYDMSQTRNISFGGMLFTIGQYLEKGTLLDMIVKFPFIRERIKMVGEVAYCGLKKGNIYEVGVRFVDLEPRILEEFKEYLVRIKKIREADGFDFQSLA